MLIVVTRSTCSGRALKLAIFISVYFLSFSSGQNLVLRISQKTNQHNSSLGASSSSFRPLSLSPWRSIRLKNSIEPSSSPREKIQLGQTKRVIVTLERGLRGDNLAFPISHTRAFPSVPRAFEKEQPAGPILDKLQFCNITNFTNCLHSSKLGQIDFLSGGRQLVRGDKLNLWQTVAGAELSGSLREIIIHPQAAVSSSWRLICGWIFLRR